MIRVLNLFTILNRGGAETMVMNYYRYMDRTKIQFDFAVHREEKGDYEEEIQSLGGKIFRLPAVRFQNYWKYKKAFAKIISENNYQIIHSHMSELGLWAFQVAKQMNVPVRIVHAHNAPSFTKMKGLEILKYPLRLYLKKQIIKHSTHLFSCSEEASIWFFGKQHLHRVVHVKNAIEVDRFRYNPVVRDEVRKEFNIDEKTFLVGNVANLSPAKNHKFLLDIFTEILKLHPDSKLLLVGSGKLKESIEKRAKDLHLFDKVIFAGKRNDVDRLLQAMDIFIFPSTFEGLGIAVIEAAASGVPVLASENISIQAVISPIVEQITLKKSPFYWASKAITFVGQPKKDTTHHVKDAGFDVKQAVDFLESFYQQALRPTTSKS